MQNLIALVVVLLSCCFRPLIQGRLPRQPTLDVLTGYTSSRPMTCTSGCYYSFSTPDDGRKKRPKHVE